MPLGGCKDVALLAARSHRYATIVADEPLYRCTVLGLIAMLTEDQEKHRRQAEFSREVEVSQKKREALEEWDSRDRPEYFTVTLGATTHQIASCNPHMCLCGLPVYAQKKYGTDLAETTCSVCRTFLPEHAKG